MSTVSNEYKPTQLTSDELAVFYNRQREEKSVTHYVKDSNLSNYMYGGEYLQKNIFFGIGWTNDVIVGPGLSFNPKTGQVTRDVYNDNEVVIFDSIRGSHIRLATDDDIINWAEEAYGDIEDDSWKDEDSWMEGFMCVLYEDNIKNHALIWNTVRWFSEDVFDEGKELNYSDLVVGSIPSGMQPFDDEKYDNAFSDFYYDLDTIKDGLTDKNAIRYLYQVAMTPMLLPDEEAELVNMSQSGGENAKLAQKRLIESNLRCVIAIAKQYKDCGMDFADLIRYGNKGLYKAARRCKDTLKKPFIIYADMWIRKSIIKALGVDKDPLLTENK